MTGTRSASRAGGWLFWGIVCLALLLRLAMVWDGKSLWGDEFFSIGLAHESVDRVLLGSVKDVHPPLFFLLLHALIHFFGSHEWVYRLVSLLAGIALVPLIHACATRLFGRNAGIVAAFSVAISPYWLQNAHEIRGYALLACLITASFYCLIRFLENPDSRRWMFGYVVAAVLAIYTEHYGWFWILAGWSMALFQRRLIKAQLMITFLGLPSLGLIFYQSFNAEPVFSGHRLREYWVPLILLKKWVGIYWHFLSGYYYSMLTSEMVIEKMKQFSFFWITALNVIVGSCMVIAGLIKAKARDRSWLCLLAMITVFPVLFLLIVYPIRLDSRYLSFSAPFVFLLFAVGLSAAKNRWVRAVAATLFLTVSIHGAAFALRLNADVIHREDFIGLTRFVFERASAEDVVCGLDGVVRYYDKRGVFDRKAAYYGAYADVSEKELKNVRLVWVMEPMNMHPPVAKVNYEAVAAHMAKYHFVPAADPMRFGEEEGQLVVYRFKRRA